MGSVYSLIEILKTEKEIEKRFFVFEINAYELVALNRLYEADNACHQQAMC